MEAGIQSRAAVQTRLRSGSAGMLPKEMIPAPSHTMHGSGNLHFKLLPQVRMLLLNPVWDPELPLGSPGQSRGCAELTRDGGGQREDLQVCWVADGSLQEQYE